MSLRESLLHRGNWTQFIKFGLVGGSGVLVNIVVAIVMFKLVPGDPHGIRPILTIPGIDLSFRYYHLVWVMAFIVANFTNYQLNRSWTFGDAHKRGWWRQFWPFFAIGSVAAFIGMFVLTAFNHPSSPLYLPQSFFDGSSGLRTRKYWAQAITVLVTMPINFIVNKLWTFAKVRDKSVAEEDVPLVAPVVAPELVDPDGEVRLDPQDKVIKEERNVYETADRPELKG